MAEVKSKLLSTVVDDPEARKAKRFEEHFRETMDLSEEHLTRCIQAIAEIRSARTVSQTRVLVQALARETQESNSILHHALSILDAGEVEEAVEFKGSAAESTLDQRLEQLRQLLETSPSQAASAIVAGLTDPTTEHAWRRSLVFAAEIAAFTETQDHQLVPTLLAFVEQFRDSNCREDQIAVGAAIRTCVGAIPAIHLESLAAILEPGHRASPGLDVVLEVAKMVARKTAANPPVACDQYPRLSKQLVSLASAHLNPYVFPHGKNAALAMNAIVATIGLGSSDSRELLHEVNESSPLWFRHQLRRRLDRLWAEWTLKRDDAGISHEVLMTLRNSIDLLDAE